jgi:NAD(P)H dehydrogenase (quinone)
MGAFSMTSSPPDLLVTAASGQLGRLVVQQLLETVPAGRVAAAARRIDAISDLKTLSVDVRLGDYTRPETLEVAMNGIERILLISSSELGTRVQQHRNVIDAAKRARVKLLIYTSMLHANTSSLGLAAEHVATESYLAASGIPYVLLRNGWYNENHATLIAPALQHGAFIGAAQEGRIASAARKDFAAAAAAVLAAPTVEAGRIFELAGDSSYSLSEFAAHVAKAAGKPVPYVDLGEEGFRQALLQAGLSEPLAGLLSDSDAQAAKGELFDDGRALSALIGRPTTPVSETITETIARIRGE